MAATVGRERNLALLEQGEFMEIIVAAAITTVGTVIVAWLGRGGGGTES
ncbi:hypothetical protein [Streptomyces sp. NPDC016845]